MAVCVLAGAGGAAPAGGAIKVTRDGRDNVLAKFRTVECLFKDGRPLGFLARGRAGGWAFRSNIYARRIKRNHGYEIEYGDDSRTDVLVFPPQGPPYTNLNEPQPGGMDVFGDAGGAVLTKKDDRFGVGLPLIYDGEQSDPPPNYVTVSGFARCTN